jgi:uncharacterized protein YecE (DUF72 family)
MAHDKIYVGPAGWSYADWRGVVYPASRASDFSELAYLAHYFDTIEINSTFYRIPDKKSVVRWASLVQFNKRFRFTVKLWQKFTHTDEPFSGSEVTEFTRAIDPLLDRDLLGGLLIQFPWRFKREKTTTGYVIKLAESFSAYRCFVEFRHSSWISTEFFSLLREHDISFVNIDQPVIGKSIPPTAVVTSKAAYVRLHGRNYDNWFQKGADRDARYDYTYSDKELDSWVLAIDDMSKNTEQSYVIFNNHFRGQAIVNGLQILAKIRKEKPAIPSSLVPYYPQLKKIGIPDTGSGTMDLFA